MEIEWQINHVLRLQRFACLSMAMESTQPRAHGMGQFESGTLKIAYRILPCQKEAQFRILPTVIYSTHQGVRKPLSTSLPALMMAHLLSLGTREGLSKSGMQQV